METEGAKMLEDTTKIPQKELFQRKETTVEEDTGDEEREVLPPADIEVSPGQK